MSVRRTITPPVPPAPIPDPIPATLSGAALVARRQALGMPQHTLAALAVMAPHTLGRVERGERDLTPVEARRIAFALDALETAELDIRARAHTLLASA